MARQTRSLAPGSRRGMPVKEQRQFTIRLASVSATCTEGAEVILEGDCDELRAVVLFDTVRGLDSVFGAIVSFVASLPKK
mmetsp:Transcript_20537/g.44877  ORF Transcript_20537/g.44877 Transcript_20537/m.44877 type:complete len:80 (+) Transcript_20537:945-1184(+)